MLHLKDGGGCAAVQLCCQPSTTLSVPCLRLHAGFDQAWIASSLGLLVLEGSRTGRKSRRHREACCCMR